MPLHREQPAFLPIEGWSSDFSPLPSAFSPKWAMALLLRSHNGVHCCGTVGDLHSRSQLSAVKHTSMGDSLQNHGAKIIIKMIRRTFLSKKYQKKKEPDV